MRRLTLLLIAENALDATTGLAFAPSSSAKAWAEFDIAAEPEPYEESYLPCT